MEVVTVTGAPAGIAASLVRNLFKLAALAFSAAGFVVALVAILASEQSQRIGDKAAHTVVVYTGTLKAADAKESVSRRHRALRVVVVSVLTAAVVIAAVASMGLGSVQRSECIRGVHS